MATTQTANPGPITGPKHVQTRFKDAATGKSLHPLQRTNQVQTTTLPVNKAAGQGINSSASAPASTGIVQPAVLIPGNPQPMVSQAGYNRLGGSSASLKAAQSKGQ